MNKLTPLLASMLLAFGISGAAVAQSVSPADNTPPAAQQGEAPAATTEFTDQDVEKFAEVQPAIEEIRAEYSQRLLDVNDPDEAARLQSEAVERMVETVNEADLAVETYNGIAIALQSDTELRSRVESMLN